MPLCRAYQASSAPAGEEEREEPKNVTILSSRRGHNQSSTLSCPVTDGGTARGDRAIVAAPTFGSASGNVYCGALCCARALGRASIALATASGGIQLVNGGMTFSNALLHRETPASVCFDNHSKLQSFCQT